MTSSFEWSTVANDFGSDAQSDANHCGHNSLKPHGRLGSDSSINQLKGKMGTSVFVAATLRELCPFYPPHSLTSPKRHVCPVVLSGDALRVNRQLEGML